MRGRWLSGGFGAASVVMLALFAGHSVFAEEPPVPWDLAVPAVQTGAPEVVPETQPAPPETEPVERTRLRLDCDRAAGEMDGSHIFVWDLAQGEMLSCTTDPADRLYPASVTKLYTAYVALMYLEPETVVTLGREVNLVRPGSSTAYLARGQKLTVAMLIEAMLLPSGNDAAYALAAAAGREIAGEKLPAGEAVAVFVEEMNQAAQRLGLGDSHFTNPDGYHDPEHYSCPRDVAWMASLALHDPVIGPLAGLYQDSVRFASGESITWRNTNRLLNPESQFYCPTAVGGKTGYTSQAGYCLLASFREGEREILVGVFGGEDKLSRYSQAVTLWETCR